jgi:hypothetical protein
MRAVVIDSSGTWWRGTEAGDLDGYLVDYRAGGYAVARVVHASCSECGGSTFDVVVDDEQGYAERSCASCAARVAMLDSVDVQEEADAGDAACPCGNETFEVAVGFAVRTGGHVRWVSIGARCVRDGVMGVYSDWKIDYSPTAHLFDQV